MKKRLFFIYNIIFLSFIFIFSFSTSCFASYPKLVSTLLSAFEKIKDWFIAISTPAVAVAVRNWSFYEKV